MMIPVDILIISNEELDLNNITEPRNRETTPPMANTPWLTTLISSKNSTKEKMININPA
ncbi:hypothetical protein D3C86_1809400 [compost metagenome]